MSVAGAALTCQHHRVPPRDTVEPLLGPLAKQGQTDSGPVRPERRDQRSC